MPVALQGVWPKGCLGTWSNWGPRREKPARWGWDGCSPRLNATFWVPCCILVGYPEVRIRDWNHRWWKGICHLVLPRLFVASRSPGDNRREVQDVLGKEQPLPSF